MDSDNEEFLELLRLVQRQYQQALDGNRPVFCQTCRRPFRARLDGKSIYPYMHSCPGPVRALCPGSTSLAALTP